MSTTKLYANKDGERAQVAFMRLGTANGSDKVVRIQRGMQVLYDDWPQCTISANAEHTTGIAPATLRYGQPWAAALIPDSGYGIDTVEVLMDGNDITQEAYQDGIISIDRVTGNVVMTVETASVTDTTMFTKRTTANGLQVLNNKALLKRIKGNSMNFWQKLVNPDFSNGQSPWIGRTGYNWVITVEDGILSIKAPSNNQPYLVQETIFTEAHTYLCIARVRITDGVANKALIFRNANNTYKAAKLGELNTWYIVSRVIKFTTTPDSVGNRWFGILYDSTGATMEVDWAQCIDLTRLLGSQSPTIYYDTFHKLFPLDVYNQGSIIINNSMTNYVSKDKNEETLQNVSLNVPTLTGKLNGEGESTIIFPNGMLMSPCLYATELESLRKSDSKASYFSIPYIPKGQDIRIRAKFSAVSYISSASYLTWFAAGTSSTNRYTIYRSQAQDSFIRVWCGCENYATVASVTLSGTHTIDMSFGLLNYGTRVIELGETIGAENTSSFYVLAGINAYFYYFQVYKGEDLVVDCIPYRIGGTVGLFDRVNGRFITLTQVSGEGAVTGVEKTYEELPEPVYDEIKQDNGIWKAYKRVDNSRTANNANTGRGEYTPLENEEVYVLDYQTIPTEITVADQGVEEILPVNEATPVTAPAIMEIQYGAIPSRGLLGGLLGGTKGGGSDEPDYSDGEEITDYEEEQETNEDSDKPIIEEPKEDIKESPANNEKQELKK